MSNERKGWLCGQCDELHYGLPAWGHKTPAFYAGASPQSQAEDFKLDADTCVYKDEYFFVRCVLVIPVVHSDETFELGVWVSLSRESFKRYVSTPDDARGQLEPMFGYLNSFIAGYPDTLGLQGDVVAQTGGLRPCLHLFDCDHPLARQQQTGVTYAYAADYTEARIQGR